MKPGVSSFGFVALVFLLLCAPLIFSRQAGGYADDEDLYHLPAVRQIRAHWPGLDLNRDALSAISPGYHYVLATVSLVTGPGRIPLRLVTWALSLGLLWLLWRLFPPGTAALGAAALLPLACSNFFIKSASWIVTDNPGLLCVTGVLAVTFFPSGRDRGWRGGLLAGAATFLRQLHVWTVVPLALRCRQVMPADKKIHAWRLVPLLVPLGVLGLLAWHWHGIVPLAWQNAVSLQGSSPVASLCYLLAVFFLVGIFYHLALAQSDHVGDWRRAATWQAAAAGLLLGLLGPTEYSMPAGRWGGYLWSLSTHLPVLGNRSLLFLILTPLGAALLAVMTRQLARQSQPATAWLWLGSFLAWAATSLASRLAFHRYFEPTILIFLILWVLLVVRGPLALPGVRVRRLQALAVIQGVITLATAHYQTYGRGLLTALWQN